MQNVHLKVFRKAQRVERQRIYKHYEYELRTADDVSLEIVEQPEIVSTSRQRKDNVEQERNQGSLRRMLTWFQQIALKSGFSMILFQPQSIKNLFHWFKNLFE